MKNAIKIESAPGYVITPDAKVFETKTEKEIVPVKGTVTLKVDNKEKRFRIDSLKAEHLPQPDDKKTPAKKAADKKAKKKSYGNGGKKDKKWCNQVREDFDKDPEKFDIGAYAEKQEVSYGRIWSIVKLHKAKLANPEKEEARKARAADKKKAADKKAADKKAADKKAADKKAAAKKAADKKAADKKAAAKKAADKKAADKKAADKKAGKNAK